MKLMMILAASVALASPAAAATMDIVVRGEPVARVVNFADLNIGSTAGRAALSGRIRSAADFICTEANIDPVDITIARKECYRTAVSNGEAKADAIATGHVGGR